MRATLIGADSKLSLCRGDQSVTGNTAALCSVALGLDVYLPQWQPKVVDERARIQPPRPLQESTCDTHGLVGIDAWHGLRSVADGALLCGSPRPWRRRKTLTQDYGRSLPAQPVSPPAQGVASQSLWQHTQAELASSRATILSFSFGVSSLLSWLGPCVIRRTSQRVGGCWGRPPRRCLVLLGGVVKWPGQVC